MTLRSHGDYSLVRRVGSLLFTAGFTARQDGVVVHRGVLGGDASIDEALEAVRLASLNAVAALRSEIGPAHSVEVVQLNVFVRALSEFSELSVVGDAATEVMRTQLAQTVPPARAVIGVSALPGGSLVEVTLIAQLIS